MKPGEILERLAELTGLSVGAVERALLTVVIVVGVLVVRRLVLFGVHRRFKEVRVRYHWRRISAYLAAALGVLLLIRLWFGQFTNMSTFLGLFSAGLAIALRDPVVNLAGWLFILIRRPFEVGDRIEIGDFKGDVIDARIFQFTLLEIGGWVDADQSTGRVVHIPNGQVFTLPVANYIKGFQFIWNEIPVLITFESDWKLAKSILAGIADEQSLGLSEEAQKRVRKASRRFMIHYAKLTPAVFTSVRDSGVLLTIRYLCDPRKRRSTEQALWESVLDAFAQQPNIDLAYPTTRFYRTSPE